MSTCVAYDTRFPDAYGYQPSLAAGIVFVVLFFLSSFVHAFQAFRYRTPWLAFVVIGAFAEGLGWIARTAAHKCVYSFVYFDMQISLLIMAPAWTTSGIYVILFKMIPILGPHTSPFPPKLCLLICFVVDIVSLTMQAVGGGLAGAANDAGGDMEPGTYTMVAGILFQLASTLTFTVLMSIVFLRGWKELLQSKPLRLLAFAMQISITCMVTRGIYRSVELLQGWTGYLNTYERFVIGLDAAIMVLAVVILNIFNPGKLLAQARADKDRSIGEQVVTDEQKSSPPTADSVMA